MLTALEGQPETRSAVIEEIVRVNIEIGDIEQAAGNLETAKALFKSAAAPMESVDLSPDTQIYVYLRLGDIEAQQGIPGSAAQHFRKALERAQSWVATSGNVEARRDLQAAYRRLANSLRE